MTLNAQAKTKPMKLFKNALIYDGTGRDAFKGDILTENDRIIKVEECITPKEDNCLYMTDAWVEDHGIQNPAIYDCFPKFLKLSLCGTGDTMPNTIRKMTGAVAERFSIKD